MSNKIARRRQPKKGKGKPNTDITLHQNFINKMPITDTKTGKTNTTRIAELQGESMVAIEDKRKRFVKDLKDFNYMNQPIFDKDMEELADRQGKREALEQARMYDEFEQNPDVQPQMDSGMRAGSLAHLVERLPENASHDIADRLEEEVKKMHSHLDDEIKNIASQPATRYAKEDKQQKETTLQKSLDRQIEDHRRKAQKQFEEENK